MKFNSSKLLFLMMLGLSSMISISSNSWPATWIGLEINLMAFIPLMLSNNIKSSEASINYFIIQALGSSIMLTFILINHMNIMSEMINSISKSIVLLSLMIKMGAAPLHMWFPIVMENLSWMNCFILTTWQKLAPMMISSYLINQNYLLSTWIIMFSITFGAIGGLNQTSIRKIMAYSSINHLGWMLMAMKLSSTMWIIYFIIYTLMLSILMMTFHFTMSNYINELPLKMDFMTKFLLFMNFLSLGGLPPFLGFLPKWMMITDMAQQTMYFMVFFMTSLSLIALFYYLQLTLSSLTLNSIQLKWNYQLTPTYEFKLLSIMTSLSLLTLPIYSYFIYSF